MGQMSFGAHGTRLGPASSFAERTVASSLFMVKPDYFDVVAAINPHMQAPDGSLRKIDRGLARKQWEALQTAYRRIGIQVKVFEAKAGCPDMVFCANQTLPFVDREGKASVVLSNMADNTRHQEVEFLARQLSAQGIRLYHLPQRSSASLFEGMGDALWVPGRQLLCGGYGFRTDPRIYQQIYEITGVPLVLFELKNPKFYHLDTCLSILDDRSALACREGFTGDGWNTLSSLFPHLIEVPLDEADSPNFACNAHCPDEKHVFLQRGSVKTCEALMKHGFVPVELETEEFIKSGGSVFCMKLQCVWDHWPIA